VVHGGFWKYEVKTPTMQGDLNVSAFGPTWSKVKIFEQVAGLPLAYPGPVEFEKADTYCSENSAWPSRNSLAIDKELLIVCLPIQHI
jgi:hypothetical protein